MLWKEMKLFDINKRLALVLIERERLFQLQAELLEQIKSLVCAVFVGGQTKGRQLADEVEDFLYEQVVQSYFDLVQQYDAGLDVADRVI